MNGDLETMNGGLGTCTEVMFKDLHGEEREVPADSKVGGTLKLDQDIRGQLVHQNLHDIMDMHPKRQKNLKGRTHRNLRENRDRQNTNRKKDRENLMKNQIFEKKLK